MSDDVVCTFGISISVEKSDDESFQSGFLYNRDTSY